MKQLCKSFLKKSLALTKVYPTGMTDLRDIRSLIKKLYPLSTNKELIRLGPKGDGGYLLPNDLVGIQACFSPGISSVSGFEKDCADLGIKVYLADKSIDRPADEHELFHFTKKFVGAISDNGFMTLENWVDSSMPDTKSDLLLQIDIEGFEYEVFLSTSEDILQRFRIIVAEFHQLDQLWSRPFFNFASRAFDKVLQAHTCVHIHPNNCCGHLKINGIDIPRVMEFTFLRKDRIENTSYQRNFPSSLDYDNTPNPSLTLPKCWYLKK